jgi:hypothetical protein
LIVAHDHHEHNDTYYLEQLSMIGVCGAFAAAAIALYYWQQPILTIMFGQGSPFQDFVIWSGFALLALVVVRVVTLWIAVGRPAPEAVCAHVHSHDHDHGHDCDHDRGPHGHEHDHNHSHTHEHVHGAAGDCGHDHSWAPWRYVVLLVPIMLFLLGLPNKGPEARAHEVAITSIEANANQAYWALAGVGPLPSQQLVLALATVAELSNARADGMDFKSLQAAAQNESDRTYWKGKNVRVVGQFVRHNDKRFSLVRFRIQCCAGDAVQYQIPSLCRESLVGLQTNQWVEVVGRAEFQPDGGGGFITILLVPRRQNIVLTNPDPNPYIQ